MDIKFYNSLLSWALVFACLLYSILTPLKDYFYPHLKIKGSGIINKKLPIPFYIPFEDSNGIAFVVVFLMECCCNILVHCLITSIHEAYISLTGQIYGEMKLLNYSLHHLEQRSMKLYIKKKQNNTKFFKSEILYQQCLKDCLREDWTHHKTLVRYSFTLKISI